MSNYARIALMNADKRKRHNILVNAMLGYAYLATLGDKLKRHGSGRLMDKDAAQKTSWPLRVQCSPLQVKASQYQAQDLG
jgi:hypothetical protein